MSSESWCFYCEITGLIFSNKIPETEHPVPVRTQVNTTYVWY